MKKTINQRGVSNTRGALENPDDRMKTARRMEKSELKVIQKSRYTIFIHGIYNKLCRFPLEVEELNESFHSDIIGGRDDRIRFPGSLKQYPPGTQAELMRKQA